MLCWFHHRRRCRPQIFQRSTSRRITGPFSRSHSPALSHKRPGMSVRTPTIHFHALISKVGRLEGRKCWTIHGAQSACPGLIGRPRACRGPRLISAQNKLNLVSTGILRSGLSSQSSTRMRTARILQTSSTTTASQIFCSRPRLVTASVPPSNQSVQPFALVGIIIQKKSAMLIKTKRRVNQTHMVLMTADGIQAMMLTRGSGCIHFIFLLKTQPYSCELSSE